MKHLKLYKNEVAQVKQKHCTIMKNDQYFMREKS